METQEKDAKKKGPRILGERDLKDRYIENTRTVKVECRFDRPFVGGRPAGREGVAQFVIHQLGLKEPDPEKSTEHKTVWQLSKEGEEAVARILSEEGTEKDKTPEEGELKEKESFGVKVMWRCPGCHHPVIGDWMVKACLKTAASRLGLFVAKGKMGSKGDLAEFGSVMDGMDQPTDGCRPWLIHLYGPNGGQPVVSYRRDMGKVQTPQGARTIVSDAEQAEAGSLFSFVLRVPRGRLNEDDIERILAHIGVVGLGSVRSLENGKLSVTRAEIGS